MKTILVSFALSTSILFSGCYGSFKLVQNIHEWNGSVTDNKFVHELLFIGLNLIPVYGIGAFGDALILNTIEFWTGENPLALKEGEEEIKYVKAHGHRYKITATTNQYLIEEQKSGKELILSYEPAEMAWYMQNEGCCNKLTQFEFKNNRKTIKQFFPNGSVKLTNI